MALGAQSRDVVRLILRQGILLTLGGLVLGIAGALALTRFLSGLLFEVKPSDPVIYAAVSILLAVVAIAACLIPARRATKVDPLVALRYE
jgi:ABC-type antimicrobial peptide transport system permease subunit